eukprot:g1217.t1
MDLQPVSLLLALAVLPALASQFDPRRVNEPPIPYALQPLQWGAVEPRGWLREWALAARHGAASPTRAAFATYKPQGHSVDGWRDGRPEFGGFWDEDSAYWIDGMARLGLVLHDDELIARAGADIAAVVRDPWRFHNTWKGDAVEGWVRAIYARAMLAYYSGTAGAAGVGIPAFLAAAYANYTPADSTHVNQDQEHQGSRSMAQMEALLEARAFGAPASLASLALGLMGPAASNGGFGFLQALLSGNCTRAMQPGASKAEVDALLRAGGCEQHAHGVTFNEVAKLFAMAYPYSRNASHLAAAEGAYAMVQRWDTLPHGVNSAFEDMDGVAPDVATETCDVSDFLHSNAWLLRVTGRAKYADRLERAFFNAAPGAVNRSFSGHVYFQQPNFAPSSVPAQNGQAWDAAYLHTPPCCTGNQARMLPEFIHHAWWGAEDGGLVLASFAPTRVTAAVNDTATGALRRVVLDVRTQYPFAGAMNITLAPAGGDTTELQAASFSFSLRVRSPGWLAPEEKMAAALDGAPVPLVPEPDGAGGSFLRAVLPRGGWRPGGVLQLVLPLRVRAERGETFSNGWTDDASAQCRNKTAVDLARRERARVRHHNERHHNHNHNNNNNRGQRQQLGAGGLLGAGHCLVAPGLPFCTVSRGPLLFALPLEQSKSADDFGFALDCDAATMAVAARGAQLPSPFDWPLAAPLVLTAQAARIKWEDVSKLPAQPVPLPQGATTRPVELVPYGCAKRLHVSMFPLLQVTPPIIIKV